jgi:hypothetical protein
MGEHMCQLFGFGIIGSLRTLTLLRSIITMELYKVSSVS